MSFVDATTGDFFWQHTLADSSLLCYERRSINKFQNIVILLNFQI